MTLFLKIYEIFKTYFHIVAIGFSLDSLWRKHNVTSLKYFSHEQTKYFLASVTKLFSQLHLSLPKLDLNCCHNSPTEVISAVQLFTLLWFILYTPAAVYNIIVMNKQFPLQRTTKNYHMLAYIFAKNLVAMILNV